MHWPEKMAKQLPGLRGDPGQGPRPRFRWVSEPTSAEQTQLAYTIAHRDGRLLEREGLLERDTE